ncbi:MAG: Fe-S-cluster-containing hydrogenase [Deltaproteobacteria bacterium]|nr:Fe-S-cluster-containing hydrogenase [Deltaproteobacteria bacterium]
MPSITDPYWKSLGELATVNPAPTDEFPPSADTQTVDPLSRRNFFRLMGASMALAGVAGPGCQRYEREEIVPLSRRPEDQVPGTTLQYASTFELAGVAHPVLVGSYEGRPIKIDGNPFHPFTGDGADAKVTDHRHGGSTAFVQASVLNLYDQDRSRGLSNRGKGADFNEFKAWLATNREAMKKDPSKVRVLSEALSSPTLAQLRRKFLTDFPGAKWAEWEPISFDNERAGLKLAFGKSARAFAHLDRAETIVVLDGDIFVEHPAAMRYSRDWKASRGPEASSLGDGKMNRLWSVESSWSSTGAMADHRLALRAELVLPFAQALDAKLSSGGAPSAEFLNEAKVAKFLTVLVEELGQNRGKAVVIAGRRQPPVVHALVARINEALGAPVDYYDDGDDRLTHKEAIVELANDIKAKAVSHLFVLGGNPAYDAPNDLDLASAIASVENSVHLSEWDDETSEKTTWHVPRANYLESWGDARTWDGTWTIAQPLILPLYGGISALELMALVMGDEQTSEKLVRGAVEGSGATWRKAVHDGFVASTAFPTLGAKVGQLPVVTLTASQQAGSRGTSAKPVPLEVVFQYSSNTWDGRFANNAWLQETPDFFTKVCWDNYAIVAPATATEYGLETDSLITVELEGRKLELACYVMPGQAIGTIGLVLGGGRVKAGSKGGDGKTPVGFDTYKLRTSAALDLASGAKVTAGSSYQLSGTQEHWDIRGGLDKDIGDKGIAERLPRLVKEVDQTEYRDGTEGRAWDANEESEFWTDPDRGTSLFQEHTYEGHKWGMAIDLGSCTSCNACMVACQSENNIPVVGKAEVVRNREMHWIRIDRYFKGSPDDPQIVNQPVGCQQCENAPCEQVCPVGATLHSSEGLNDMVYNRCVGTRYCLNNCPYRVRRFNFLDWNAEFKEARNRVRKLVMNPEVTVRMRGVMEKCTYCVQRIQNKKIKAKNEKRSVQDGEITTACQDACPTQAIVFGDLNDPKAWVTKFHKDRRAYSLLGELNTKPRTQYLARVRNPNPKLA